jgi:hypothetical protein
MGTVRELSLSFAILAEQLTLSEQTSLFDAGQTVGLASQGGRPTHFATQSYLVRISVCLRKTFPTVQPPAALPGSLPLRRSAE